jgi:iron complex outermembrane recepter protein
MIYALSCKRVLTRLYPTLLFLALSLHAVPETLLAQSDPVRLTLSDAEQGQPISYAAYHYGTQQGYADADGLLLLTPETEAALRLVHLEYGEWTLSAAELIPVFREGVLRWASGRAILLQPVTVIALHASGHTPESRSFSAPDWLAHDAGQILAATPGIAVIRKAGQYGFDPVVRGFKYDQLNIVIDGAQHCLAACPNRMDPPLSQISLNQMEKVEVIKGPYALRYGTGLGGTILFSSLRPAFLETPTPFGRISSGVESNGGILRTEGLVGIRARNLVLDLNAAWSEGGDYSDGNGERVSAGFRRGSFGTNLHFRPWRAHQLSANLTHNRASDVLFAGLGMDLRKDHTWLSSLRHEWQPAGGGALSRWSSMVSGTFVDHRMDNGLKDLQPRMMNMATDATTQSYAARSEITWRLGGGYLYTGLDFRQEQAQGQRVREFLMGPMAGTSRTDAVWQDARIRNTGLFAEWHRDWAQWQWVSGARLAVNEASAGAPSHAFAERYPDMGGRQINPSLSTGLVRTLSKDLTLGLWAARTQRSGSLIERYIHSLPVGVDPFEMLGNPGLKPEVNHQMDLNLRMALPRGHWQLNLFGALLQDMISGQRRPDIMPVVMSAPGVRQFVNIGQARMAGAELQWAQCWPAHLHTDLQVAWVYGEDRSRSQPLQEMPPLEGRFRISGMYLDGRLQPAITWRGALAQERISGEFGEWRTPGFQVLDLQCSYHLLRALRLTAGVHNLFDTSYTEHLNRALSQSAAPTRILMPGRNFFITASYDLSSR